MATIIQQRNGTAAEWTSANPVLAIGEMGVELDTHKFKVGDGVATWSALPYSSGVPGPTGPAGEGFDYKGDWINGATYAVNDVVRYTGSTWICTTPLAPSTTPPPAAGWELFTAKGDTGPTGPSGPTGPTGAVGPGVPSGGTVGQYPRKTTPTDYDTAWKTLDCSDIADITDGSWTAFTPTWTASGTPPALGNGSISGAYCQVGKLIVCRGQLTMGNTTTFGTGAYSISLPAPAAAGIITPRGLVVYVDASAGAIFYGTLDTADGGSKATLRLFSASGPFAELATANESTPMAFADGDYLQFLITYEAA